MNCPICGKKLLGSAVPADEEWLFYVHRRCYRPWELDRYDKWGVTSTWDVELVAAAAELGIPL